MAARRTSLSRREQSLTSKFTAPRRVGHSADVHPADEPIQL
ncbi:hypothetical protein C791_0257 [Amycolatopsis azurea DSM 43854]|uniref:Uncharacterized protein n=1 Tax=Amycolatopsis azurea DSM 43854 TaxID=1238180 RepID=M2PVI1_9PSEU|nr:hypothetical protein C791_0257 [Amycolatopsis azurea DSM 43854]